MSRVKYWWHKDKAELLPYPPNYYESNRAHYVQQDTMEPLRHPSTGEVYESKSAFRRQTKALGLEEVGNDWNNKSADYFKPQPKIESSREFVHKFWADRLK